MPNSFLERSITDGEGAEAQKDHGKIREDESQKRQKKSGDDDYYSLNHFFGFSFVNLGMLVWLLRTGNDIYKAPSPVADTY